MGLRAFYWRVIRIAFAGKLGVAQAASGAVATFSGAAIWYSGKWESAVNVIPFAVFAAVFIAAVVVGLIVAPHRIYLTEYAKNLDLKRIPDSVRRFVSTHDKFTLEEAACLLAETDMRQDNIVGPASGFLHTLQERAIEGKLKILNDPHKTIQTYGFMRRLPATNGQQFQLNNGLEITKSDLENLATEFSASIPGLTS